MNVVRLLPVFLSFLLISAHFQRAGQTIVAVLCLVAPGLLYFARPWSLRILQMVLVLSAFEWVRTLVHLVQLRLESGLPWVRLAIILSGVALFTAASALVFRHKEIQKNYMSAGDSTKKS